MKKIPTHIALIPDGNRRWAKKRKLPTLKGHQKGYQNFLDFCKWCRERQVKIVTAFGFSTENWNRSKKEVDYLMDLFEFGIKRHIERYKKGKVDKRKETKIKVIGKKERFSESLQKTIEEIEKLTKDNKKLQVNIALDYGGKWDILQAVKKIIKTNPNKIEEKTFQKNLSTGNIPDPDLVIRVGGEKRLSNFVIWQIAYSELYFSDKFWPDFSEKDLDEALKEYDRRQRRFGQ